MDYKQGQYHEEKRDIIYTQIKTYILTRKPLNAL